MKETTEQKVQEIDDNTIARVKMMEEIVTELDNRNNDTVTAMMETISKEITRRNNAGDKMNELDAIHSIKETLEVTNITLFGDSIEYDKKKYIQIAMDSIIDNKLSLVDGLQLATTIMEFCIMEMSIIAKMEQEANKED